MKRHLFVTVAAVAIAVGAMITFPSVSAAQTPSKWRGIMTSVSSSATISTESMSPGGEIWAGWYSLPPGKTVDIAVSREDPKFLRVDDAEIVGDG